MTDIIQVPVVEGSDPSNLVDVGETLFFTPSTATSGRELWKSNGTDAGTVRVKDIFAGSGTSSPNSLTNVNGTLFFSADDGTNGRELWRSNGTDASIVQVKDIFACGVSSNLRFLTNVNGTLFFAAMDDTHRIELWTFKEHAAAAPNVELSKNLPTNSGSGSIGVTLFGAGAGDRSGRAVHHIGDMNGDGFYDLVIGARYGATAGNAKVGAGESYVVFGKADWSASPTLDLATLNGTNGFTLFEVDEGDRSGCAPPNTNVFDCQLARCVVA